MRLETPRAPLLPALSPCTALSTRGRVEGHLASSPGIRTPEMSRGKFMIRCGEEPRLSIQETEGCPRLRRDAEISGTSVSRSPEIRSRPRAWSLLTPWSSHHGSNHSGSHHSHQCPSPRQAQILVLLLTVKADLSSPVFGMQKLRA